MGIVKALDNNNHRVEYNSGMDSTFYSFYLHVQYKPHCKKTNTSSWAATRRFSCKSFSETSTSESPGLVVKKISPTDDNTINHSSSDVSHVRLQIRTSSNYHMEQYGNRKRKRHSTKGNPEPDFIVEFGDLRPIVIFQIKQTEDFTSIHEGISQLISFGLSLRHQREQDVLLELGINYSK